MNMSLRQYLFISIILPVCVLGGVTIWSSHNESRYEVQELFDAQLARSARVLLGLTLTEIQFGHVSEFQSMLLENRLRLNGSVVADEDLVGHVSEGHYYELKLGFQVWDKDGNMILRSVNLPLEPLSDQQQGYSDKLINNQRWRIFSLWDKDKNYHVMTAERYDVRLELIDKITWRLILPFVIFLPVLAWLVWVAAGKAMSPLRRIAADVKSRDDRNLERIDTSQTPAEILPLIDALNQLFEKLKTSFKRERRFTSDAAHELRTPLAAMKIHAQLAASSENMEDMQHSLSQLIKGVDRSTHLVDQLLTLARLEPEAISKKAHELINLQQLSEDIVSDLALMADEKDIELTIGKDAGYFVAGDKTSLAILIRNLLDNAIRYTPRGGIVTVAFSETEDTVTMQVIDSGPGIQDENERQRVFERFYRIEGVKESGCGIGLSIVRQIANSHNAVVNLTNRAGVSGLQVDVIFTRP